MTRPTPNRPTVRLSSSCYRGREIVVSLHPTWMGLRLKGTRHTYTLDYLAAYHCAAKLEADRVLAVQAKTRNRRRINAQS